VCTHSGSGDSANPQLGLMWWYKLIEGFPFLKAVICRADNRRGATGWPRVDANDPEVTEWAEPRAAMISQTFHMAAGVATVA